MKNFGFIKELTIYIFFCILCIISIVWCSSKVYYEIIRMRDEERSIQDYKHENQMLKLKLHQKEIEEMRVDL